MSARDLRVLLLWLLAGLIGAGVAYRYFFRAFPEASVDFKVTRTAALDEARDFAAARGAQLPGYKSSIVFNVDDNPKTYLERELGLEQANRLFSSDVNVWFWEVRFFRPLQKEEFRVAVAPDGRVVGFDHILTEDAPGAHLDRAAALARAEDFLRSTLHTPLENYTFLPEEANSVARPNRADWTFTWERTGFRAKDAPYRLHVSLAGDRISGYSEGLQVPEAWRRSYAQLRSSNDFIETLAVIPYALLLGAALSVVIALGRQNLLHWAGSLKLGLFITLLYFLMTANSWPLSLAGYDTNGSYASFWLGQLGTAVLASIALSLLVVIAYAPGEALYRMGQPERLRLGSAFSFPGLRTKEFFVSLVIGVCLAAVHIGYVVLFYVLGSHVGVWAPQDLQYSDTLSTALPWLTPLAIGIYAATSEEFLFRMFSIRFLLRNTNSKVLAVVLSAFAWGFLHANYPQEPPYIRGIEVGLIGIVAGIVMLRWGILATLTWHYSVDAFLTALSLLRSHGLYNQISGGIVGFAAFIPLAIAGVFYLARGGFVPAAPLLNAAAPLAPAAEAPPPAAAAAPRTSHYAALSRPALQVLGLAALAGAAVLLFVRPAEIGDFVRFSVDARQAESRADDVLRARQVDPSGYRRVAVITTDNFDPLVNEYLRRYIGIDGANRVYRDQVPSAFWFVRYFRDSQPEEYRVVLLPDGGLHSVHHVLAEAAPGQTLAKEDAQARAENFLIREKGLNLAAWRLVESQSDKRPARTDHTFEWQQIASLTPAAADGEGAHVRVSLQVQGDEVSGYRVFIHLPEEWRRAQQQDTLAATVHTAGLRVVVLGFAFAVLVIFFRGLKSPAVAAVPWRRLARGLVFVFFAAAAAFVTSEPQYLLRYTTDRPFVIYLASLFIGLSLASVLFYSLTVLLFGLACFFLVRAFGEAYGEVPAFRGMPAGYYRDAFFVALGGGLAILGFASLSEKLAQLWPVARYEFPARLPEGLDALWPALHALASALFRGFAWIAVVALALAFASYCLRQTWLQALVLVVLAVLLTPRWGSPGDFFQSTLLSLVGIALLWWAARRLLRFNLLGYLLLAVLLLLAVPAADLLRQPNPFFRAHGLAVAAMIILLLGLPLAGWWSGSSGKMIPSGD